MDALEVNNFRNLSGKIFWGSGLNIIHGNNGQGKPTGSKPSIRSRKPNHFASSVRRNLFALDKPPASSMSFLLG